MRIDHETIEKNKELAGKNWQRIITAMNFEEPDQVPFFLNVNGPYFTSNTGTDIYSYYHDPELMLQCQLDMYHRFPGLTPIVPDVSIAAEPSALGAEVTFTKDGTPWAIPFIKTEEDIEKLEIPNLDNAGYMTRAIEYCRFMQKKLEGTGIPVSMGAGHSPWGVACLIRDTSEFMMDIIRQPDFAKKLLRKCTDLTLAWLRMQQNLIPPENFKRILIWDDLAGFVGLDQFRKFILPVYEEIYAAFPECERWYHNDSETSAILEGLAEAKIQMFHYGYETDPAFIKEKIGDRVCLMGNIPPLSVLREGTPEEVDLSVKEIIKKSAKGGGLVVAAGGYIDEGTPIANLEAMIRACEKYGRRDQAARLVADYYRHVAEEAAQKQSDIEDAEPEAPRVDIALDGKNRDVMNSIQESIINGRFKEIAELVQKAISSGISPQILIDRAMTPGMDIVGQRFADDEIFIPEMMMSAQTMKTALAELEPLLAKSGGHSGVKIAIGTVKEDLHDIGKNIVIAMMEGAGFDVVDLGIDCPAEKFCEAVEQGIQIIGLSVLLTTTLKSAENTINMLKGRGLRDKVYILVGGAAMTESYANQIGSDGYCPNAGVGVKLAKAYAQEHGLI